MYEGFRRILGALTVLLLGVFPSISPVQDWAQPAQAVGEEIDRYYSFDGIDDVATDGFNLSSNEDFSIEMWLYFGGTAAGTYGIFRFGDNSTDYKRRTFAYVTRDANGNNTLKVGINGTSTHFNTGYDLPDNEWIHFAIVREASNAWRVDINGTEVFSDDTGYYNFGGNPVPFRLGDEDSGGSHWKGRIDQVKIWDGALTSSEVQTSMSTWDDTGITGKSLLHHYDFNDASTTQVTDQQGTDHLSWEGSPAAGSFGDVKTVTSSGLNTVVEFPRSYLTSTGGWTIPAGLTAIDYLLVGGGGSGGSTSLGSAGGGGGGRVSEASSVSVTASTTVAVTVGSGGIPLQISGQTVARGSDGGSTSLSGTGLSVAALGGSAGANAWLYNPPPQATASTAGFTGGGGSSHAGTRSNGSTGVGGTDYKGGTAWADCCNSNPQAGGGGGGADDAGANATLGNAGAGGTGASSSISGTATYYGGGGGGGKRTTSGTAGSGGQGGGGAGGKAAAGNAGGANTGGGGGGAGGDTDAYLGGFGGSGIAIVRYVTPQVPGTVQGFSAGSRAIDADSADDSVTLSWTALTGQTTPVSQYEIEYSSSSNYSSSSTSTVVVTDSAAATPNSVTLTDLNDGERYYFRIKARNAVGVSASYAESSSMPVSSEDYALDFNASNATTPWTKAVSSTTRVIPNGDFTFEAWIRPSSKPSTWQTVFFQGTQLSDRLAVFLYNDDTIHIGRGDQWANIVVGDITNQWSHLAVTGNGATGTSTFSVYLNGFLAGTGAPTGGEGAGGGELHVGIDDQGGTLPFDGAIDQVKIWSSQLTAAQIQESMHTWDDTDVMDSSTLVSHFDFNDNTQSTVLRDMQGSNDLVLTNASTSDFSAIAETPSRTGYDVYKFSRSYLTSTGGWTVPAGVTRVEYLVVGGGGGGGGTGGRGNWSAGGGAGGSVETGTNFTVSSGSQISVIVGAGGTGGSSSSNTGRPSEGGDSSFATVTARGGGRGGHAIVSSYSDVLDSVPTGGVRNGGGGGAQTGRQTGASGAYNGGNGFGGSTSGVQAAGGGAGAGGNGVAAVSGQSGAGGIGVSSSIAGSAVFYGGGGGGGKNSGSFGAGGAGGGGAGGSNSNGVDGTSGLGGGGGGAGNISGYGSGKAGGDGGSGIVVLAVALSYSLTLDNEGSTATQSVVYGENPSDPGTTRTGYTLLGWSDGDDDSAEYAADLSDYTMGAANDTIFAVWQSDLLLAYDATDLASYNTGTTVTNLGRTGSTNNGTLSVGMDVAGQAFDFPDSNTSDFLDLGGTLSTNHFQNGFTIDFYAAIPETGSWDRVLDFALSGGSQAPGYSYNLVVSRLDTQNKLSLHVATGSSNLHNWCNSAGDAFDGTLKRYTISADESGCTMYISGTSVSVEHDYVGRLSTDKDFIPVANQDWDNLYIGRSNYGGDNFQAGEIRSLRILTSVYSPAQIDALYDGDLTYQTLTFDSNGGTDPTDLVTSGSLRLPSPGARSGFSFGGWYADETYSSSLGVAGDSYTPGDTSLHALWTGDALTPTFGSPTRTADGFTAQISNFDDNYTYAGSVTTGSVSISGSGLVTVTGVAAGTSSTVTVTTSRTGYSSGSGTVSASSLNAALTSTFGTPTSTADGFTVQISNFDSDYTYAGSATAGSVSISGSGLVTVTGLAVATSTTVTITTTQTGYVQGSATVTASSLSTVTVTFKSNYSGGASDETQTVTASQSTALDENPFTRDGYTFVEWTTASGGSGTAYADEESVSVSSNTILYAQWTKVRTPNLVINLDASNPQSLAEDSTSWSAVRPGSSTSSQTGRGNVAYSDVGGIPALSFDGSGDYFEYTDVSDSRISGDMTLEMWIKPADLRSGWNILATRWFTGYNSQGNTTSFDWHFAIRKEGANDLRLNLFTSNSSNLYGSRAFTSNSEWVLVGFTIDASGNQRFFVNGVQDGTTRTGVTHNNSSTAKFFIGDPRAGAGFPGSINAVRMYDTALTSAQMAANFDAEYETFGYRKITFNENVGGGSDTENQYVLNNTATNLSANPFTRDGYRFTGWKTVSSGAGTEYSDNESVTRTSDLTLYAQWELNEYTVTYSKGSVAGANGADQTATKTHGVTLGLLNSDDANDGFSKTGYTVTGWSTNADGSTTDFALGANYTTDAAVTLYPVWTANTYTVSYTYNGATGGNSVSSVDYTVDGILVALPNPTKTGYTFAGWYSNIGLTTSAGAGGASYTPTDDVTLYAKWDATTFTVIYAYNGATGGNSDDDDQYTTGDTVITLPTPTKEGYNFSGWYSDATLTTSVGAAGDDYSPTSNLTIYAKWTAITRSVTYSNETSEVDLSTSGSVPVDSGSYIIGDTVVVKANSGSLARTGYTFEGWVTNSNGTGTALNAGETVTVAEDDITFYPKWEPATYTLTYHANGGSGSLAKASDSYVTGTAGITFPGAGTLSKTGYTFEGWSTSPTGTALADGYTTAQNRTLYAVWDIKSINFSYAEGQDGDGGSLSGFSFTAPFPSGSSENFGTDITLSTSVDAEIDADGVGGIDHQFFGWSDGTTVYQAGDTYRLTDNSPITFTAQWIKVFSVRYALAGGSFAGSDDETDSQCLGTGDTCTDGQVISLNSTPSRPGYTFLGWEDQSGNLKAASASTAISDESYLFTARWEAIDYTLSFNSLGGTRVFNDYTQNIGDRVTMPNPGSKTGYTFGGWSDGSTLFGIGSTFTVGSSSKSFTAQWIADVYTVTYDWQGGTGSTPKASDSYTVGTGDMTLPTAVGAGYSRDGYVFSGWSTSIGGGVESGFRPTADDVLYAVWADGNYTLTYNVQGGSTVSDVSIARTTSTTLATPTRANFTFVGWYTAASGGSKVGDAGDSYTPTATTTLFARWVQDSLYGVDEATLETATTLITADGVVGNDQSASATSGSSRADVVVPGGSLPDGTIISIRYFRDTNRQSSLISGDNTFFFSVLVSWLYGSGTSATVPDTHPLRPIEVTLTNSAIKAGARVYQVIGTQVTDLGVAVADGSVTVELYSDPQLVVAATAPSAPTSVTGSAGDTRATISWTAGSTGGSPVTGYTVTANPGGATCSTATTSCTIGSLSNNTAYTFTVRATNGIGTSSSSTPSSAVTPVGANYDVTFNSNGGSAVADGSFFSGSTVSAPSSPSRSGYVFQGWSTTLDDDTTQVTFPYAPGVTNAITLYALWEAAPPAPTTGGSRGGAANTNAQNILRAPVVVIPRVLGPTQPVAPPRPFTAPVVISPQRGFDPDAGSQARVGGLPATVSKTSPAPGAVSLGVGSVQVGITPQNSPSALRPVAPAAPTDVAVSTGQSAVVAGAGLLPGSQLQVWLPGLTGSSARELARIPVRADGTFESEVSFSARQSDTPVPIGRQVIQVTGFDEQGNQTVVDMTITIGQGDPAPEVTRADNALPDLSPGQSLATSAGVPETVTIQARPETREVAVVSGEWAFTVALAGDSGAVEQVDSGATITLVQAKTASVSGEGFQPGTRVDIWLFSDPTLLGSVTVSADGGFTGDVFLDARYAVVGEHTLQLQGVGADGFIKAANLGVVVQEPVVPDPVTSSPWTFWVLILMSVALAGAVILVAARRRRVRG